MGMVMCFILRKLAAACNVIDGLLSLLVWLLKKTDFSHMYVVLPEWVVFWVHRQQKPKRANQVGKYRRYTGMNWVTIEAT